MPSNAFRPHEALYTVPVIFQKLRLFAPVNGANGGLRSGPVPGTGVTRFHVACRANHKPSFDVNRGLLVDETALGDTPVSRCQFYRRECGLPAVIDPPELGRIILRAGSVWGVTMPVPLGQRVKAHLQSCGDRLGPIIAHPRSGRWTFLVDPDIRADDMDQYARLFRLDVSIADTGSTIALPSPSPGGAIRRWIVPPRNAFRPSGRDVLTALRVWRDDKPVNHDR
ncbi:hypothetical protein [Nocardia sp. R7R-8]|uniref:hypothetical protein n=1 Tax=Nocardia sp. R7R-8 TaxID=3459304 RepID=UPI00403DD0AC